MKQFPASIDQDIDKNNDRQSEQQTGYQPNTL